MEDIAIYPDGSGSSVEVFETELKALEQWQQEKDRKVAFLRTHESVLNGLRFSVCVVNCEIELWGTSYRGKSVSAIDVARLFPQANWDRKVYEYDNSRIDWIGELDGVTLKIPAAESRRVPKMPPVSGRVKL
ncbi:hypothetical protein GYB59_19015 [bacterium]|nr:hypothetical protein [bacterium]